MIELTQEQVQALGGPAASLPRVVNPETRETFVLVPVAEYERLVRDVPDDAWTDEERDGLRWQACEILDAFGEKP